MTEPAYDQDAQYEIDSDPERWYLVCWDAPAPVLEASLDDLLDGGAPDALTFLLLPGGAPELVTISDVSGGEGTEFEITRNVDGGLIEYISYTEDGFDSWRWYG